MATRNAVSYRSGLRFIISRGFMAATCLAIIGCGPFGAKPTSIEVPLEFKPRTDDTAAPLSSPNLRQVKLLVQATEDKREEADRAVIGVNTEDSARLPVHGTGSKVPDLVNKILVMQLKEAGVPVTKEMPGDQSTFLQLQSEVIKFFVTEGGNYKAEVSVLYRLLDSKSTVIFEKQFTGNGQNYGSSKSAENYQETYSDALKRVNIKLINDAEFVAALTNSAKP